VESDTYPDDWVPTQNMSTTHTRLNPYDGAIDASAPGG